MIALPHQSEVNLVASIRLQFGFAPSRRVERLPGGASSRLYFRISGNGAPPSIAMYVPEALSSDEIDNTKAPIRRWPFLEIRDLLASRGVNVPVVHAEACDVGLVLLEDLGDLTLALMVEQHPELMQYLYKKAIADLARAQRELEPLPPDSVVVSRQFDEQLLRWEIEHFREWALEARGLQLEPSERLIFDQATDWLVRTIVGFPTGFVHRDYQSRNLMVRPSGNDDWELTWLDFQDALLGPRVYDLVALLQDSYQTFDHAFVQARLDDYLEARRLLPAERARLTFEFDVVTVQRKLKDAGRFVYIDRVKGNPGFLGFVSPTIAKVRAALGRLAGVPEMARLAELLDQRLPSQEDTRL